MNIFIRRLCRFPAGFDGFALPFGINFVVPMVEGDGVGNEGGIDHQFADPVAFGFLFR